MREREPAPPTVHPMTVEDLDEVLAIERVSFRTPWSRGAFHYELTQNRVARCLVVREGHALSGYLCLWEIGREVHITNVAVDPARRRRGLARLLLGTVLDDARVRSLELVFLEVRPTNSDAVRLYESLGFRIIGRRKGYYFDTGEDALVMEATPSAAPGPVADPAVGREPGGSGRS